MMIVIRGCYMLAVPILLVLISVWFVMSPIFLRFEYYRFDFPEDSYGFTTEDRMTYAPRVLNYLFNDADISYLGEMTFPNGRQMFNQRELRHMEDVKIVTRNAYLLLIIMIVVSSFGGVFAWRRKGLRQAIKQGLLQGAVLTIMLIIAIVLLSILAWDLFFTAFHDLFFASGTWRFAYSDTLIRLFPERFWFDAAITVGLLTLIGTAMIVGTLGNPRQWFIR
jgi:integral membrane protein (TIGR01906 family)